jgi:hypothetical protein
MHCVCLAKHLTDSDLDSSEYENTGFCKFLYL